MFQKNNQNDTAKTAVGTTIIGPGTECTGDMHSQSDLRIDGIIQGNIHCRSKVVVGSKGKVTGKIICVNADISGEIVGNIICEESLVLRPQARIEGNITSNMLQMEAGVVFNGQCTMDGRPALASKAAEKEETNSFVAEHVN